MEFLDVADIASTLFSEDLQAFTKAAATVKDSYFLGAYNNPVYARFIQELANYKQGSVMKHLVELMLSSQSDYCYSHDSPTFFEIVKHFNQRSTRESQGYSSFLVLSFINSSKAVSNLLFEHFRVAERLFQFYLKRINIRCAAVKGPDHLVEPDLLPAVQGLLSCARHSKDFRQLMIQASEELVPSLNYLASEPFARIISRAGLAFYKGTLGALVTYLVLSSDSRPFVVDKGFLNILIGVCEVEKYDPTPKGQRGPSCNLINALLCLFGYPDSVKQMRQAKLYPVLLPHAKALDPLHPGLSKLLKKRLSSDDEPKEELSVDGRKTFRQFRKAHLYGVGTICSWSGCTLLAALYEEDARFKRCGRCGIAHYCSKEHQKRHWPSHKMHCLKEGQKLSVDL